LSLTAQGWVRYQLKTPYRDGTTHVEKLQDAPAMARSANWSAALLCGAANLTACLCQAQYLLN